MAALTLGALGVVYGDIGTSPLYALREVFASKHAALTLPDILGVLSLVFWTLTVIVSLKYVALILRANNNGEGGTMALMALSSQATRERPRLRTALIVMGILGAALFYGDGVITPAISVLSAVEGLELATPAFKPYVVPITLVVLFLLYAVQKHGTGLMGRWFGPITLVWFLTIAYWGVVWIIRAPVVLQALNPWHALRFGIEHGHVTLLVLGAVFLAVTGAEALYADMGHFGQRPIQLAWFALVFPALVLNYFGQGALMLLEPAKATLVPAAHGGAGHGGHGNRIAGHDLRHVLGYQAGDPARLPATPERAAHLGQGDRPDLHPWRQLAAVRRDRRGGADVRLVERARHRLWHRRHRDDGHHHGHDLLCDPLPLELPVVAVPGRHRLLPGDRTRVLFIEHHQGAVGRLVHSADCRRRVHADDDLGARPPVAVGEDP